MAGNRWFCGFITGALATLVGDLLVRIVGGELGIVKVDFGDCRQNLYTSLVLGGLTILGLCATVAVAWKSFQLSSFVADLVKTLSAATAARNFEEQQKQHFKRALEGFA